MGLRITVKFDLNGITETQMAVVGGSGDSCLLSTKVVRDLNKNSIITNLPEFYENDPIEVEAEKDRLAN